VDLEKLTGWWKGGSIGAQFLQLNAEETNQEAGSVQGYSGIPGLAPLTRSELYQLWFRQSLFNEKLIIRIGKSIPTYDFGNVLRPLQLPERQLFVPGLSGLIYTPVFINPTMLGVMPGYYNSAYGLTVTIAPVHWWYFNYGLYDGNLARGVQTGLTGPDFNNYILQAWETGFSWRIGPHGLPGKFGTGMWYQTGTLTGGNGATQNGTSGYYAFATQRLWYLDPAKSNAGVSIFSQFGVNDSSTLPVNQYFGAGLTAFGLVPMRPRDSFGGGISWSFLNSNDFNRSSELMFQGYYQANIWKTVYMQPTLTYIPTPGADSSLGGAWAVSVRATVLF